MEVEREQYKEKYLEIRKDATQKIFGLFCDDREYPTVGDVTDILSEFMMKAVIQAFVPFVYHERKTGFMSDGRVR